MSSSPGRRAQRWAPSGVCATGCLQHMAAMLLAHERQPTMARSARTPAPARPAVHAAARSSCALTTELTGKLACRCAAAAAAVLPRPAGIRPHLRMVAAQLRGARSFQEAADGRAARCKCDSANASRASGGERSLHGLPSCCVYFILQRFTICCSRLTMLPVRPPCPCRAPSLHRARDSCAVLSLADLRGGGAAAAGGRCYRHAAAHARPHGAQDVITECLSDFVQGQSARRVGAAP